MIRNTAIKEVNLESEEVILTTQSLVSARRAQDELAITGGYLPSRVDKLSVVYTKANYGITTSLSLVQEGTRRFRVIKKTD